MCNRIRGLKEWSVIPRDLGGTLINFEYNPNVAPTERVPAFLAERGKERVAKLARFGINLPSRGDKKRPPLLNARTDTLPKGAFKSILTTKHAIIPAEGFMNGAKRTARSSRISSNAKTASRFCSPRSGITRRSKVKRCRVSRS